MRHLTPYRLNNSFEQREWFLTYIFDLVIALAQIVSWCLPESDLYIAQITFVWYVAMFDLVYFINCYR